MKTLTLNIKDIIPDKDQPRKYFDRVKMNSLRDSIKKNGVLNPIVVEKEGDHYLLIDGERRYKACLELGLKEIPVTLSKATTKIDRLIQQFHIQEQHEGWSPVEKAIAIRDISKEMNVSYENIGEILGIAKTTLNQYRQFVSLIEYKYFQRKEISINWINCVKGLVNNIRTLYRKAELKWDETLESKIEKRVIDAIKDKEILKPADVSKLKDAFRTNSKNIDIFLGGKVKVHDLIKKSGSKSVYHLRNVFNNCTYLQSNIRAFIENNVTKIELTTGEKSLIKNAINHLNKLV